MFFQRFTVYERQYTLLFKDGAFECVLTPGRHKFFGSGRQIVTYPKTSQMQALSNQDIMSKDGASIKMSLILTHSIADAVLYFKSGGPGPERVVIGQHPEHAVVLDAQVALRDWVSVRDLEQVLADRDRIAADLRVTVEPKMTAVGLKFESILTRDVVIGGALRTAYADLLKAKLEAQSALERARGESATMRSLLNTARLVREN